VCKVYYHPWCITSLFTFVHVVEVIVDICELKSDNYTGTAIVQIAGSKITSGLIKFESVLPV
jgi:hypothetical protein